MSLSFWKDIYTNLKHLECKDCAMVDICHDINVSHTICDLIENGILKEIQKIDFDNFLHPLSKKGDFQKNE
ncbi:MAG: hypothetical protein ACTSUI_00595 [Promethearchaeota archaeon]